MADPGPGTSHRGSLVVAVGSQITPSDLPTLCAGVRSRLEQSGAGVVVIDLAAVAVPDAVTIDAMARLALVARRLGCRVQLRDAPDELAELLAFSGLGGVLPLEVQRQAEEGITFTGLSEALPLEVQRQAEEREDAFDVEEEAELDDPTV